MKDTEKDNPDWHEHMVNYVLEQNRETVRVADFLLKINEIKAKSLSFNAFWAYELADDLEREVQKLLDEDCRLERK